MRPLFSIIVLTYLALGEEMPPGLVSKPMIRDDLFYFVVAGKSICVTVKVNLTVTG